LSDGEQETVEAEKRSANLRGRKLANVLDCVSLTSSSPDDTNDRGGRRGHALSKAENDLGTSPASDIPGGDLQDRSLTRRHVSKG
jgi:hypothetical protein